MPTLIQLADHVRQKSEALSPNLIPVIMERKLRVSLYPCPEQLGVFALGDGMNRLRVYIG